MLDRLAAMIIAAPAGAQEIACPPDVPAITARCVPVAGLIAQLYAVGDVLSGEVPLDRESRDGLPPLAEGEGFAVLSGMLLRVDVESRRILDVLAIAPIE
jgi:hypothetical protein